MRNRSHLMLSLATAGAVALGATAALATVVVQPSLEQMTARSGVIVHGVVTDQVVVQGEEGRILTLSSIRVTEGLKGAKANDTVTLYQVGGELDGHVARIAGVSAFAKGEEVILFGDTFLATDTVRFLQLERKNQIPAAMLHPSGPWLVPYGIGLGKFRVDRSNETLGAQASEELGDVAVATPGPRGMVLGGRVVRTQQPLNVMLDELRRLVAEGGTR